MVRSDRGMNIPSHSEMIAQYHCGQLSARLLEDYQSQIKSLLYTLNSGQVINHLGSILRGWKTDIIGELVKRRDQTADRDHRRSLLARYNEGAGHYRKKSVFLDQQIAMTLAFDTALSPLFYMQLNNLHHSLLNAFLITKWRRG
jgi:hypothetical protein